MDKRAQERRLARERRRKAMEEQVVTLSPAVERHETEERRETRSADKKSSESPSSTKKSSSKRKSSKKDKEKKESKHRSSKEKKKSSSKSSLLKESKKSSRGSRVAAEPQADEPKETAKASPAPAPEQPAEAAPTPVVTEAPVATKEPEVTKAVKSEVAKPEVAKEEAAKEEAVVAAEAAKPKEESKAAIRRSQALERKQLLAEETAKQLSSSSIPAVAVGEDEDDEDEDDDDYDESDDDDDEDFDDDTDDEEEAETVEEKAGAVAAKKAEELAAKEAAATEAAAKEAAAKEAAAKEEAAKEAAAKEAAAKEAAAKEAAAKEAAAKEATAKEAAAKEAAAKEAAAKEAKEAAAEEAAAREAAAKKAEAAAKETAAEEAAAREAEEAAAKAAAEASVRAVAADSDEDYDEDDDEDDSGGDDESDAEDADDSIKAAGVGGDAQGNRDREFVQLLVAAIQAKSSSSPTFSAALSDTVAAYEEGEPLEVVGQKLTDLPAITAGRDEEDEEEVELEVVESETVTTKRNGVEKTTVDGVAQEDSSDEEVEESPEDADASEEELAAADPEAYYSKPASSLVSYVDAWEEGTDGGCFNYESWWKNPQYLLWLSSDASVTISLTQFGSSVEHIGFYVLEGNEEGRRVFKNDAMLTKCTFEDLETVSKTLQLKKSSPASKPYVIIPATYDPCLHSKFKLTAEVESEAAAITLHRLMPSRDWAQATLLGKWEGSTAGGCRNYPTHINNDQYLVTARADCDVRIVLESSTAKDDIGIYVLEALAPAGTKEARVTSNKLMNVRDATLVNKSGFNNASMAHVVHHLTAGQSFIAIGCTFEAEVEAEYRMHFFSSETIDVLPLVVPRTVSAKASWTKETAGGCLNHATWRKNQQFALTAYGPLQLQLRQVVEEGKEAHAIGFYVVHSNGEHIYDIGKDNFVTKATFMPSPMVSCSVAPRKGKTSETFTVVPCTFSPGQEADFELVAFRDNSADPSPELRLADLCNEAVVKGAWEGLSAGGCLNHSTWKNNPQLRLIVEEDGDVMLTLTQQMADSEELAKSIGFYITEKPADNEKTWQLTPDNIVKKASFRRTQTVQCVLEAKAGVEYNIILCAFSPVDKGEFTFMASAYRRTLCLFAIPDSDIETIYRSAVGCWSSKTAGGSMNNMSWPTNPHYLLTVLGDSPVPVEVVLSQETTTESDDDLRAIGFSITPADERGFPCISSPDDIITKANYEKSRDVSVSVTLKPSARPYVLTPSTFEAGVLGDFLVQVFSNAKSPVYLRPLGLPEYDFLMLLEEELEMVTDMMEILAEEAVVLMDEISSDKEAAQKEANAAIALQQQLDEDTYDQLYAASASKQAIVAEQGKRQAPVAEVAPALSASVSSAALPDAGDDEEKAALVAEVTSLRESIVAHQTALAEALLQVADLKQQLAEAKAAPPQPAVAAPASTDTAASDPAAAKSAAEPAAALPTPVAIPDAPAAPPTPAPPAPPAAPSAPPPPSGKLTSGRSPFKRTVNPKARERAAANRERSATRDRRGGGLLDSIKQGVTLRDSSLRKLPEPTEQMTSWTPFNIDKIVARRQALEFSDEEDDAWDDEWA